jgi:hypothetical protein
MNNQPQSIWDIATSNDQKDEQQGVKIMNIHKLIRRLAFLLTAVGLMAGYGLVHADYEQPAPDLATAQGIEDGTDATGSFAFPTVYVSAPGTGNANGTGYADEDIMKYQSGTGTWSKAFDGTNAGLPDAADIDALTLTNNGPLVFLMSFDNPVAVPGLGTVDDSDVAAYNTVSGTWTLYLDGSEVGLSTNAEDIDGLTFSPGGFLVLSTSGNFAVKNLGGGTLRGADEDLFSLIDAATDEFTLWLKGAAVGLQGSNDINAVSFLKVDDSLVDSARYIVPKAGFTLPNGISIGAHDVSEQVWFQNGGMEYYKKYDNTAISFAQIDALEVVK